MGLNRRWVTIRLNGMAKNIFSTLTAVLLLGCGSDNVVGGRAELPIGQECDIQFRRDALGQSADLPTSPTVGGINGATVNISGTLVSSNAEWVWIKKGNDSIWIPRSVILLIRVQNPTGPGPVQ